MIGRWLRPRARTAFAQLFIVFALIALFVHMTAWIVFSWLDAIRFEATLREFSIAMTLQLFWLVVTAWVGARFMAKPMSHLAAGAARLGADLRSSPIEERGPDEARQTARVFNQMQQQILRQVEERSRFLAAVSHDLRAPLTRIRLRLGRGEPAAQKDKLLADIDEMATLVNQTLDYLRGDDRSESVRQTDLVALVEALVDDLRDEGANISAEGSAQPLAVRSVALRRCLSNLASNAIRYAAGCRVRLVDGLDSVRIEVEDDGPGIPEDQLEAVLLPFRGLDESRNRSQGGIGLGLAIANEIAKSHGGTLCLRNRVEGGLIVSVVLPRSSL